MTLLEIDSSAKSQEVSTLIQDVRKRNKIGESYIWTGALLNRFPQHHFHWLSSGEKCNFTNWKDGEPNFFKDNEFCVCIYTSLKFLWNDDPCSKARGYVCEYNKSENTNFEN